MKKLKLLRILVAALCGGLLQLSATAADASPPTKITFQGFLTDNNGAALGPTTPVQAQVIFRIYGAETGGTLKWSEQQAVTVDKGQFSVLLGEGSPVSGDAPTTTVVANAFAGADASVRWMELNVDGAALSPRIQFVASPYALLAKSATQLVGIDGAPIATAASGTLTLASTITLAGNGGNLTNLNGSNIASGTVANARTTGTSASTANTLVQRDASEGFAAGYSLIGGLAFGASPVQPQNIFTDGSSIVLRPPAAGGSVYVQNFAQNWNALVVNSANNVAIGVNTPSSRLEVGGVVTATGFKVTSTPTYVLIGMFDDKMTTSSGDGGITQVAAANTTCIRASSTVSGWWSAGGTTGYTGTFTIPTGEVWELVYESMVNANIDDYYDLAWVIDGSLSKYSRPWPSLVERQTAGSYGTVKIGERFFLTAGYHTIILKGQVSGGSGTDNLYLIAEGGDNSSSWERVAYYPNRYVLRKYKVN